MLLCLQRGGKMPHCEMTGYSYESVVSFPGEIRGGPVDVCCCVALSDLTSAVEERCHGGQTYRMCVGVSLSAGGEGFQLGGSFFTAFASDQIVYGAGNSLYYWKL